MVPFSLTLSSFFATGGAFFNASSELPEIAAQSGANLSQKSQQRGLFNMQSTSSNAEVALLFEGGRTLIVVDNVVLSSFQLGPVLFLILLYPFFIQTLCATLPKNFIFCH